MSCTTGTIECDAIFTGGHRCTEHVQYRYASSADAWEQKIDCLRGAGWAFWMNAKGDCMRYMCPEHASLVPIHAPERHLKRVF